MSRLNEWNELIKRIERIDLGDMAYKHWKITIWEHGKKEPLVTEYMGDVTEHDLIRHYGLKNPDVNRYKIEVIK